jgi:hypothetical protein
MYWPSIFTRTVARTLAAFALAYLSLLGQPAYAQGLESAVMPGAVARAHIKEESDCRNCHVRFDRAAQPTLCLKCHKKVAADVRAKAGYHGRLKERICRTCHTEHKGRDANIVKLDPLTFDHLQTEFELKGKHRSIDCAKCHLPKVKHRDAPSKCSGCHRKVDKHKNTLGEKCESCHDERDWKKARFDHAKTHFPLRFKHDQAKCAKCHADPEHFAKTPLKCIACHRKEDKHKGTLDANCEKCHDENDWKKSRFDHAKTHFPLHLKHEDVKCAKCHDGPEHFAKTPVNCYACHRKDDKHKGALRERCDTCHTAKSWKEASRFDHDRDTKYALRDAHRKAKCNTCHKDQYFREKLSSTCFACHERNDREKGHKGRYGEKCQDCHTETEFKRIKFDHTRDTRYALRAKHQQVKCDSCHKGALYRDKLEGKCIACHERDDKHKAQLGKDCDRCHDESTWQKSSFDHNRIEFKLLDRHARVECRKCHSSPAFKDAKSDCASCHTKDDIHKQRLGPKCETCHSAVGWKDWKFDHNARSKFKLVLKHVKIKCVACHTKPVTGKIELPSECLTCHRHDDIHFGTSGPNCERCHVPDNWRHVINQKAVKPPE